LKLVLRLAMIGFIAVLLAAVAWWVLRPGPMPHNPVSAQKTI